MTGCLRSFSTSLAALSALVLTTAVAAQNCIECTDFGVCPKGCVEIYDCNICDFRCVTAESAPFCETSCGDCTGPGCTLTLEAGGCFAGSPGCTSFQVGEVITFTVDAVEHFPGLEYTFAITSGCGRVEVLPPGANCFGFGPEMKVRAESAGPVTVTVFASNHPCDNLPCFDCTVIPITINITDPCCPADVDGNGTIGFEDVLAVLAAWGDCGESCCQADVNRNGAADFADVQQILSQWEQECSG